MINTFSFGSYILVYNGQIYNTKELSETLKENGFTLNSHSDTEVLLKSYIHYGKNVVNHLNGIFAFAIWDTNNNEIFLARDHFGVKPLFYTKIDETLVFSSEIKALFQYPGVKKVLNEQSISELFGIGPAHTSGTTIFKNIYEINHESLKPLIQKYYDLSNGTAGYRQIKEQLQEHEGMVISYYMSFLLKCCIMQLPEVRKKKKNKEIIKKQRNKNRFGKMKEFFREINGKKLLKRIAAFGMGALMLLPGTISANQNEKY